MLGGWHFCGTQRTRCLQRCYPNQERLRPISTNILIHPPCASKLWYETYRIKPVRWGNYVMRFACSSIDISQYDSRAKHRLVFGLASGVYSVVKGSVRSREFLTDELETR